jgi:hypothetical protein
MGHDDEKADGLIQPYAAVVLEGLRPVLIQAHADEILIRLVQT